LFSVFLIPKDVDVGRFWSMLVDFCRCLTDFVQLYLLHWETQEEVAARERERQEEVARRRREVKVEQERRRKELEEHNRKEREEEDQRREHDGRSAEATRKREQELEARRRERQRNLDRYVCIGAGWGVAFGSLGRLFGGVVMFDVHYE
jgi:hypothetical protein